MGWFWSVFERRGNDCGAAFRLPLQAKVRTTSLQFIRKCAADTPSST
jgi:hypothetical protein